jgi:hypothetical protein
MCDTYVCVLMRCVFVGLGATHGDITRFPRGLPAPVRSAGCGVALTGLSATLSRPQVLAAGHEGTGGVCVRWRRGGFLQGVCSVCAHRGGVRLAQHAPPAGQGRRAHRCVQPRAAQGSCGAPVECALQQALKLNLGSRSMRVRAGHWKTEGQGVCPAHMNGFMALIRLPIDDETHVRAPAAAAAAAAAASVGG